MNENNPMSEKNGGTVKYNIGLFQVQLLSQLLSQSSHYFMQGDITMWYKSIVSIRSKINSKLSDKERLKFDIDEQYINRCYTLMVKPKGFTIDKKYKDNNIKLSNLIQKRAKDYEYRLNCLLDEKGYGNPEKENYSSMVD